MTSISHETQFIDTEILYTWKIKAFSKSFLRFKDNISFSSSSFAFEGKNYHLHFRSHRTLRSSTYYFLQICTDVKKDRSRKLYSISYSDKNGSLKTLAEKELELCRGICSIRIDNLCDMIVNDCITIHCKLLSRLEDHRSFKERASQFHSFSTLSLDLKNLLSSEAWTDVHLKVDGHSFAAHSVILSARSPVFAAMLDADMSESRSRTIKIGDFSAQVIKNMLEYIYTGKVDLKSTPADLLAEMYAVADKYALMKLKDICREELMFDLCESNVVSHILLASRHSDDKMLNHISTFVLGNPSMISSFDLQSLVKEAPTFAVKMLDVIGKRYSSSQ